MKMINQEQYETFQNHYQLIYKNVQISEYDISNRLNPTELKHIRGYLDSGIWYNENQRINQQNLRTFALPKFETISNPKRPKTNGQPSRYHHFNNLINHPYGCFGYHLLYQPETKKSN